MSKELEQEVFEDLSKILLKLQSIPDPVVANIGMNGYGNWEPRVANKNTKSTYNSNLNYDKHGFTEGTNYDQPVIKDDEKLYDYVSNTEKTNGEIFNGEHSPLSSLKGILTEILNEKELIEYRANDVLAKYYNSKC